MVPSGIIRWDVLGSMAADAVHDFPEGARMNTGQLVMAIRAWVASFGFGLGDKPRKCGRHE